MKDNDYATLLLLVWIAPAAYSSYSVLWYGMLVILGALSLVAGRKQYLQEKLERKKENS